VIRLLIFWSEKAAALSFELTNGAAGGIQSILNICSKVQVGKGASGNPEPHQTQIQRAPAGLGTQT